MKKNEFIQLETYKANAFNLLSVLFCQPEEDILSNREVFNTLKDIFLKINSDCHIEILKMQKSLIKYSTQDLLVDYAKLFIGPFKTLAPPYSSIYLGDRTIMSEETLWVINFYQQNGVEFDVDIKDLPDHIAVETEFIYFLIFNQLMAIEDKDNEKAKVFWQNQKDFISKHYRKWVPKFCDKITKESNNEFYKSLASCMKKFIINYSISDFPE